MAGDPLYRVKPRVLVVEDEHYLNMALCRLFESWGFLAIGTMTVANAIDRLSLAFDLVVLDLLLPDGDGVEVLRAIRDRGIVTPVVVSTGVSPGDPMLEQVREQKPTLLLVKPMCLGPLEAIAQDIYGKFAPMHATE